MNERPLGKPEHQPCVSNMVLDQLQDMRNFDLETTAIILLRQIRREGLTDALRIEMDTLLNAVDTQEDTIEFLTDHEQKVDLEYLRAIRTLTGPEQWIAADGSQLLVKEPITQILRVLHDHAKRQRVQRRLDAERAVIDSIGQNFFRQEPRQH